MATIENPRKNRPYVTISPSVTSKELQDIDLKLVETLYKKHGAVLFRGFDFDVKKFHQLTQSFCSHSVFNESPDREIVDNENIIQTVNKGTSVFPLHPELSREPWKPDVCWFACETPPIEGGETTICDGTRVVTKMSSKIQKMFKSQRLDYQEIATKKELRFWLNTDNPTIENIKNPPADCPYSFHRRHGKIFRSYKTPALHTPMFSKNLAFGNFLLFARYMLKDKVFPVFEDGSLISDSRVEAIKKICDKLMVPIRWHANDILMLDNTRFMHGRNKIIDPGHRRILTYFGYLKFAELQNEGDQNARWRQAGGLRPLFELDG